MYNRPARRKGATWIAYGATLITLVGLTACSGPASTTSAGTQGGDGLTTVNVGLVPSAGSVPVNIAIQQGYFKEAGLDVKVQDMKGPAISASLLNGEIQYGSLGSSVVVTAVAKNLPLRIIAGREKTSPDEATDDDQFLVMPNSGIKTAADLSGKTVGVNSLGSIDTLFAKAAINNLGGNASKVKFIEIGLPDDQVAALKNGTVAGITSIEPFASAAEAAGAVKLFGSSHSAIPNGSAPIGVIASTKQYIAQNSKQVDAFANAIKKAVDWAAADSARFRGVLPKFTGLSAEQASTMLLPAWAADVTPAGVEAIADLLVKQAIIKQAPPANEILR